MTTLNTPPQGKDAPGTKKEKPLPSKAETSLPNILVVSIVSVFLFASLLVLLFILIRAFLGRHVQANEGSSDTQRSDVVMEIVMGEVKDDTNNCDITASDGGVRT